MLLANCTLPFKSNSITALERFMASILLVIWFSFDVTTPESLFDSFTECVKLYNEDNICEKLSSSVVHSRLSYDSIHTTPKTSPLYITGTSNIDLIPKGFK